MQHNVARDSDGNTGDVTTACKLLRASKVYANKERHMPHTYTHMHTHTQSTGVLILGLCSTRRICQLNKTHGFSAQTKLEKAARSHAIICRSTKGKYLHLCKYTHLCKYIYVRKVQYRRTEREKERSILIASLQIALTGSVRSTLYNFGDSLVRLICSF